MLKDLQGIKGCVVFMDAMNSTVSERYPLCKEDFHVLVCECASDEWKDLARTVTEGTASFQQMEEIIRISPDPDVLSRKHLHGIVFEGVSVAYREIKTLQELRHFISPFVTALRFFTIRAKEDQ
ncbi:hypothetical protein DAPPUDRAFT_320939 [Daphnia pulex]|uniref:Uncharacterized protein n=1 Tax=Daphnia pulex TaxID=6669 RepID=E9GRH7_DAPPU|nr:hypothetical protein DAPPUDRAFT_320939 [Daphnia pulex]|eukprot:EFX77911.1 hypothetical protein DAPPUDRAFT_320939 [Daphnia pulex]